jgi:ankyrin repeat protein
MYAAAKGDALAMRLLLDAGADVYTLDNVCHTPLPFIDPLR